MMRLISERQFPLARRTGRPRLLVVAATVALLALLLLPVTSFAARSHTRDARPTVVLVHGAWADPSSWDGVAGYLQHDGYRTVTPRLDLNSIDGDVAIVRATLDSIPGKKILVGHSYGGVVISNAAAGRSDVVALVYSAAFLPDAGDSIFSLGDGYAPSGVLAHLVFTGAPFASPAYIDPAFFRQVFAQDVPVRQAAALSAAQQPINPAILLTPSGPVGWHTIPLWYAVSGADNVIDPAEQRWMAARAGATTIEFPTASHIGGITVHARAFTNLIEQAIRTTTR